MNCKIDAVMIDTSAYHKNQCDFEGITNSIIPMLLHLMKANNIKLLTHPVLEEEIRKHIGESELVTRVGHLQMALRKYNRQLQLVDISVEELSEKLSKLDMAKRLSDSFDSLYQGATAVPYVEAKEIFSDYFNARPPFSQTGNKKAEFPDAFILKGLTKYCFENPDSTILVISDDPDWMHTLEKNEHIVLKDNLSAAMVFLWEQLDDKSDLYQILISKTRAEICSRIETAALGEAFDIDEIDTAEEVNVDSVTVADIEEEVVPLEIKPDSALLQIAVTLSANGYSEFLDENRSAWDKEDRCYYFCAYTHLDFINALANVECEIRINFSGDGSFSSIELETIKLLNRWDISLSLENAETTEKDITDYGEDEYRAEQAEALEEYYRH